MFTFLNFTNAIFMRLGFLHAEFFHAELLERRGLFRAGTLGGVAAFLGGLELISDCHRIVDLLREKDAGGIAFLKTIYFFWLFELAVVIVSATH